MVHGAWFMVHGSRFRAQICGFWVYGVGFRVLRGPVFRVSGLGFRVWNLTFGVQGLLVMV